ncbi:MAG: DUF1566 domain-containing protein [Cyclobacteriaceae bacterium]|nr:DUF1566 domain-containing protein [Cyclobacteriaceae bacterium]
MKKAIVILFILILVSNFIHGANNRVKYRIVDTGVTDFYDNRTQIKIPAKGDAFYGQDAQYESNQASYTDNGDGTISDNVTGLKWQKVMDGKMSYNEALRKVRSCSLGGYDDWRIPTIKELYSLIRFDGRVQGQKVIKPFIDTGYFDQPIGDSSLGEREIDAQTWSLTQYVGKTMRNDETVFGVNFIDGRIKGYPKYKKASGAANVMYFRMVRGNIEYGKNNFIDNNDGTVSDLTTGLMWQKADDGNSRSWEESLDYAENIELASYDDWRLPNAKELQSIVDYSRSPQTTNSPAIDPVFSTTEINDPDGNPGQYPYFWTGTMHLDGVNPYASAAYIAFGEGQGEMNGVLLDVHGAGCQRSDPKSGDINDYPQFFGPQGDVRYVYNYTRCVRNIE